MQYLQVFAVSHPTIVLLTEHVISDSKDGSWKHLLVVAIVGKGSWLADQRLDDMTIVDGSCLLANQAWHRLNDLIAEADNN